MESQTFPKALGLLSPLHFFPLSSPKHQQIPTFASDGRRIGSFDLARVDRLLGLSLVVVRRGNHDGKGSVTSAA